MAHDYRISVPRQCCSCIKSSFIHTISLASAAFTSTCALAARRKETKTRLKAELAQAYQEIAFLKEELSIKCTSHELMRQITGKNGYPFSLDSPLDRIRKDG